MSKVYFLLIFILSTPLFAHDHVPSKTTEESNANAGLRIFKSIGRFTAKLEYQVGDKYEQRYSFYKIGTSYKLQKGLKLFAYYSGHRGLRHQDDWIIKRSGYWDWTNTGDRLEHLVDLGVRYKFRPNELAPYLFGLEGYYQFNDFNGQSIFIFEPSFHYFILEKGRPSWSYKAKVSLYHPLNFESEDLYKKGIYLSLNRHLNERLLISLSYRYLDESWAESQLSLEREKGSYTVDDITHSLNLNISLFL
jgi:hypothetical protein